MWQAIEETAYTELEDQPTFEPVSNAYKEQITGASIQFYREKTLLYKNPGKPLSAFWLDTTQAKIIYFSETWKEENLAFLITKSLRV